MSKKEAENLELDNLDKQILSLLLHDARTHYTEIARQLVVSGGTVHVRMKKMEEMGVVKGAHLSIDVTKVGYDICAFIGIYLEKGSLYKKVVAQMKAIPEIVEVHYTTGAYSMFAKIICRDTQSLRSVLNEKLQAIPGIARTETFISLEESIRRPVEV